MNQCIPGIPEKMPPRSEGIGNKPCHETRNNPYNTQDEKHSSDFSDDIIPFIDGLGCIDNERFGREILSHEVGDGFCHRDQAEKIDGPCVGEENQIVYRADGYVRIGVDPVKDVFHDLFGYIIFFPKCHEDIVRDENLSDEEENDANHGRGRPGCPDEPFHQLALQGGVHPMDGNRQSPLPEWSVGPGPARIVGFEKVHEVDELDSMA